MLEKVRSTSPKSPPKLKKKKRKANKDQVRAGSKRNGLDHFLSRGKKRQH